MATTTGRESSRSATGEVETAVVLRHLDRWLEKELITPDEAAAIREFERVEEGVRSPRIAPIVQALLYMGSALTLAAVGSIYWRLYEDLPRAAKVSLPALLAVILAATGWFTARRTDADLRRFGGVLLLLSTGAFAGFLSELIMSDEVAGDWSLFLVGTALAIWAGAFVVLSPRATTQLAFFGSAVVAAVGLPFAITNGFAIEANIAWLALSFSLLGVGWIAGGQTSWLRPAVLSHVLGGALVLFAPTFLFGTDIGDGVVLLAGSVVAGGLLGASAWLRSPALIAVGAVGLYAYSFRAIWVYFGDNFGMPVVLLIGGLLLLGIALGAIRLGGRRAG